MILDSSSNHRLIGHIDSVSRVVFHLIIILNCLNMRQNNSRRVYLQMARQLCHVVKQVLCQFKD